MTSRNYAVVGGGVVGAAVARELLRSVPGASVTLFEKEDRIGAHQSSHNSGVVHAGLYYVPGGLKATLCRRGVNLLKQYCRDRDLPYDECGKLVVATDAVEADRLRSIHERAVANGVPGVRMLGPGEMQEIEPSVVGVAALHSPETAITDYGAVAQALADDVAGAGGQVRLRTEVLRVDTSGDGKCRVATAQGVEVFDRVIACAGLQSDRVARRSGYRGDLRIVPFFGKYFLLKPSERHLVRGLIYPVPDPRYPFLGVHLTKRVDGEVMLGPNAFLSMDREAYGRFGFNTADTASIASFAGFWRFAAGNAPTAARELRLILSKSRFVEEGARYVPLLKGADVVAGTKGIRAQAMRRSGSLADDFEIARVGAAVHLLNAPSPGATSSLAIAEYVVREIVGE